MVSNFKHLLFITTTIILIAAIPLTSLAYSTATYQPDPVAAIIYQTLTGNNVYSTTGSG